MLTCVGSTDSRHCILVYLLSTVCHRLTLQLGPQNRNETEHSICYKERLRTEGSLPPAATQHVTPSLRHSESRQISSNV
jgi:hypothetical protein